MDIFKAEKAGNMRKFPEVIFSACQTSALATCCNPLGCKPEKKRKTRTKSKTPGALIYNVPGSRSGGIPLRAATDMVATVHWTVSRGGIRYRSLNRRCSRLERARRSFRANKLGALLPSANAPLGHRFPPLPRRPRVIESRSHENTKNGHPLRVSVFCGRSGGIRTRGLLVPNQTRYQTALHLDT